MKVGMSVEEFEQMVIEHKALCCSLAYGILDNSMEVDDAWQDACIKAFKARHQYRGGKKRAWLVRIVRNVCYDAVRDKKRKPVFSIEDIPVDEENLSVMRNKEQSPHDIVESNESMETLCNAIRMIPSYHRDSFILQHVYGYSLKEICKITNTESIGTVKTRVHRARKFLKENQRLFMG